MVVSVMTSDGIIWNRDKFILDLIVAGQRPQIMINLRYEGPDCGNAGIDDIISTLAEQKLINADSIVIRTSNQISSSQYREERVSFMELKHAQELAKNTIINNTDPVLKFGIFIGRSNWLRLGLASYIWKHYRDSACMTFHYDSTSDYHQQHCGLEEFISKNWCDRDQAFEFISNLPIKFDNQTYPILWSGRAFDLVQHYPKFFCEIVCETFFTNRTFMVTEKTMRPIINKKPFIVQGPKWYLKNLHSLGFKTFNQWWDESYDQDPSDSRYTGLKWNIDYIAQQDSQTINKWYREMESTLEHNYQTLLNLTDEEIISTEFYYE